VAPRSSSSVDVFLRLHGQRKFAKELSTSATQLEAVGLKGAKSIAAFAATGDKLKNFGRSWTRNVTLPVTVGAALAGKAAVDWESSFAGVRKTVDATEKQYARLEKGIRSMSLEIPVAANELAGIAEAAGQLGIERKAILGFTRVIADLGVATNLAGEEGATTLARFANITQMSQSEFDRLGSTIVALGNAGASTEKDIAAMGLRLAAAGNFAGMSEANVLAIANALSSVGIEAEAGGTAMSTAIKEINSAVVGGTPALEDFAAISGMGAKEFSRSWKRDAAGTLTGWIEGLGKLKKEGEDVPAILYDLDTNLRGVRVQDTLMRAAGAGGLLRESISLGNKSWKENNALTEEAEQRYKTVASQLQILKNKVIDAGVSLSQDLLPPTIQFVEFIGPKVGAVAEAFGSLPGPVKATALGFLILTGPVASGLGYFASGVGRALILVNKLAIAGQGLSIFNTAMMSGQGFRGSAAMAFQGGGVAAAANVAKGFALSLAPALAALGVANVTMEALDGDWKAAGFKAGGAIAGGIAGFMLGGPLGAMIGVGVGSVGGGLLSKAFDSIFNSGKSLPTLQEKLARSSREVARYFKQQKEAGTALSTSTGRTARMQDRLQAASRGVRVAERSLVGTKRQSKVGSDAVARAEWRVAVAQDAHRKAAQRLKRAEREKGQALRWYKQIARTTVLEERNQINNLRKKLTNVKALSRTEEQAGAPRARLTEIAKRGIRVSNDLAKAQRKHAETFKEASEKAGPKFASFLERSDRGALEFGSKLKAVNQRLRTMSELTRGLSETDPFAMPGLGGLGTGPSSGPFPSPGPRSRPRKGGNAPKVPGGKRKQPQAGASSLNLKGAFGRRELTVKVPVYLNGKTIAESTAQVAEDEAAYA
jgi:TP901 family phage tail tape measure protein